MGKFKYPGAEAGTYALGVNYTGEVVGFAWQGSARIAFKATPVTTLPSIDKPISSTVATSTGDWE